MPKPSSFGCQEVPAEACCFASGILSQGAGFSSGLSTAASSFPSARQPFSVPCLLPSLFVKSRTVPLFAASVTRRWPFWYSTCFAPCSKSTAYAAPTGAFISNTASLSSLFNAVTTAESESTLPNANWRFVRRSS